MALYLLVLSFIFIFCVTYYFLVIIFGINISLSLCCTTWGNVGCTSNYPGRDIVTTYKLPSDPDERKLWLSPLTNVLQGGENKAAVCEKHWPPGFETVKIKGHVRPKFPPSEFDPKNPGK